MHTGADTPPVRCASGQLGELEADLICAPVFENEGPDDLQRLDTALGGSIGRARASGEIRGKTHELFFADVADPTWRTRRALLVGAGARERYDTSRARTVAGAAAMAARDRRVRRLAFVCRAPGETPPMAQAAVEGILLGAFRDTRFKSEDSTSPPLTAVELFFGQGTTSQMHAAVERGVLLAGCQTSPESYPTSRAICSHPACSPTAHVSWSPDRTPPSRCSTNTRSPLRGWGCCAGWLKGASSHPVSS